MNRTAVQTMTARQYVESQGVTPESLYVDIADAFIDWLRESGPELSFEEEQDRADRFFANYAR
tara:strand:- start:2218 stop:2406 length:189 start_codon:yes stop_codon:yes gene_type:complete